MPHQVLTNEKIIKAGEVLNIKNDGTRTGNSGKMLKSENVLDQLDAIRSDMDRTRTRDEAYNALDTMQPFLSPGIFYIYIWLFFIII